MVTLFNNKVRIPTPFLVLLGGLILMAALILLRQRPPQQQPAQLGALVEVIEVEQKDETIIIAGSGRVEPRYEVSITPQVPGIVTWVSPDLAAGGYFSKGDVLVKVEEKDYQYSVDQAKSSLAQAEYSYESAKAQARIAREEWNAVQKQRRLSGLDTLNSADPLALHEPQLKQAEAGLMSAKATLDQALLNLSRTTIRAPFNGRIRSQSASPGQYVSQSTILAQMYTTDLFEIEVGLTLEDIQWLDEVGSPAEITMTVGDKEFSWNGYYFSNVGAIGESIRVPRVIVRVDDPLDQTHKTGHELTVGSYVTVKITGQTLKDVVTIPRSAVRDDNTVWVMTGENTLDIRPVEIIFTNRDDAVVGDGLEHGELIVTSSISGSAQGMKLRKANGNGTGEANNE